MVGPSGDNQENILEEAVSRFVHAQSQGEQPDADEFVKQYPEIEPELRQRIHNLKKIDVLFDSLVQPEASDFEDKDVVVRDNLVGQRIGAFEIVKVIGRGGMGVVYLAHDAKLDRSVAIKSMPTGLLADSAGQMRFRREARLLASLNHPNIAVIHDIFEKEQDSDYLVLEYVPGETLAQRIAGKALTVREALLIGQQIAEAVSAAHNKGIIHRDLKPGNIKITPEGRVKVLDFGLAKPAGSDAARDDNTVTQPGSIIGTPAYMSPEQIRGDSVDRHTDIWSFGCILYEMLTGKRPFEGKTVSDTVAHALERQPQWQDLPQKTPANIKTLLRRCLEKDSSRRLQHIGDAAIEISETLDLPAVAPPTTTSSLRVPRPMSWQRLVGIGAIILFLVVFCTRIAIWSYKSPGATSTRSISRFIIPPATKIGEEGLWHGALAISPDGTRLAYVDETEAGGRLLYLRDMDGIESRPLPGTEGAVGPFFSPDGEWLGFYDFAKRELKKIAATGGTPTLLCKPENFMGGSWGPDSVVIFAIQEDGLWRYTASKGMERLTTPDPNQGHGRGHVCPQVLPGGDAVLFTDMRRESSRAEVFFMRTGERRILLEDATAARYVPTGHLLFTRDKTLYAAPFDISELKVKGFALPIVEGIYVSYLGSAQFALSENGTLIYIPTPPQKRNLVWVDRRGVVEAVGAPPRAYGSVRISPDGSRFAVTITAKREDSDIWIIDKARPTPHQLTFGGCNHIGIWTPDGKHVIFTSNPGWEWTLNTPMRILADRSGEPEPLAEAKHLTEKTGLWHWQGTCLSPDGKYLLGGQNNIGVLPMGSQQHEPWPFIRMDGLQRHPAFSPDGHWVAYSSNETGRVEVYVRPFPGPGGITHISTEGGYEPLWSRDGKELFYRSGERMMVVTIEVIAAESGPELKAGLPQELFKGQFRGDATSAGLLYDLDSDGRFIMIQEDEESPAAEIHVVLNWFEELRRLVPSETKE
jgi:serine/threonine-protein kinase